MPAYREHLGKSSPWTCSLSASLPHSTSREACKVWFNIWTWPLTCYKIYTLPNHKKKSPRSKVQSSHSTPTRDAHQKPFHSYVLMWILWDCRSSLTFNFDEFQSSCAENQHVWVTIVKSTRLVITFCLHFLRSLKLYPFQSSLWRYVIGMVATAFRFDLVLNSFFFFFLLQ